jgi:hypothetical protein
MRTAMTGGVLAVLAALAQAAPASACGYGMPSPVQRFFRADLIAGGRVTAIEDRPMRVHVSPGADTTQDWAVAVVEVTRGIKGAEGLTHVRVALREHQKLTVGLESVFFLVEHFREPVFVLDEIYDYPLEMGGGTQKDQVKQYEQWARLLADPECGLTSRNADERCLTAALLLARKRFTQRAGQPAQGFDAKQSRLILEALAGGDFARWHGDRQLSLTAAFAALGVTEKDGWKPQSFAGPEQYQAAIKAWLNENATTFVIR